MGHPYRDLAHPRRNPETPAGIGETRIPVRMTQTSIALIPLPVGMIQTGMRIPRPGSQ